MTKNTYIDSKGNVRPMPEYGKVGWQSYQYEMMKIANKGNNFQYWNEERHGEMLKRGYEFYDFMELGQVVHHTRSVLKAKEVRATLRSTGHYATIIAGYHQTVQREKFFSILYKKKSNKNLDKSSK